MADRSSINWTKVTRNPITECDPISPDHDNCYTLAWAKRLSAPAPDIKNRRPMKNMPITTSLLIAPCVLLLTACGLLSTDRPETLPSDTTTAPTTTIENTATSPAVTEITTTGPAVNAAPTTTATTKVAPTIASAEGLLERMFGYWDVRETWHVTHAEGVEQILDLWERLEVAGPEGLAAHGGVIPREKLPEALGRITRAAVADCAYGFGRERVASLALDELNHTGGPAVKAAVDELAIWENENRTMKDFLTALDTVAPLASTEVLVDLIDLMTWQALTYADTGPHGMQDCHPIASTVTIRSVCETAGYTWTDGACSAGPTTADPIIEDIFSYRDLDRDMKTAWGVTHAEGVAQVLTLWERLGVTLDNGVIPPAALGEAVLLTAREAISKCGDPDRRRSMLKWVIDRIPDGHWTLLIAQEDIAALLPKDFAPTDTISAAPLLLTVDNYITMLATTIEEVPPKTLTSLLATMTWFAVTETWC